MEHTAVLDSPQVALKSDALVDSPSKSSSPAASPVLAFKVTASTYLKPLRTKFPILHVKQRRAT